jgi:transposase
VASVHDVVERRIRDLPLFESRVELIVPRLRMACPRCGPKLEQLSWLAPYARVTQRLAEAVARLCSGTSIRHVARFFGLDWKTVKAIDCEALERRLGPVDLSTVDILGMDEFAIQKGHRYATVIVEPSRKRVLWVGRGRGREDVRPFFELLGAEGCARIKAVAMDMNAGYAEEVRARCPAAEIVYDLFHVVAKYGREVIDRVRVDQANALRDDRKGRRIIKSSRWLLLRNAAHLDANRQIALRELLQANRPLAVVHLMRDELKALWQHRDLEHAHQLWTEWHRRAMRSRLEPLKRFARLLKPYAAGIIAHAKYPLGTNLIEGINNKIKVIKRIAYGFRDDRYFFLKIRAAFPGIG